MESIDLKQKIIELELRIKYLESMNKLVKNELIREKESHYETMNQHLQILANINSSLPNK